MRKFYSNVMQAALSLAMITLLSTTAFAQPCDIPAPEGSVWGTQFDGGLDGWTALDGNFMERKRADGTDIGWEWSADGDISSGAFAGTAPAYASNSICNGAVSLNSDFLDNQGVPNFGAGECPGGACSSILVSPTIDLSEVDGSDFVLEFASQHRQFTSSYNILLSIDDGATWIDTFNVFPDGYVESLVNSPHLFNLQQRVPLCGLGNEREVKLAIWYDANYYYWTIDDFYIIAEDKPDLRVNENWFATSVRYGTPASDAVPLAFVADIENRSPIASTGSTLEVAVSTGGEVVHTQTMDYPAMDGCVIDENRVFETTFTPEAAAGDTYTVSYTITDAVDDGISENNVASADHVYTEGEFVQVISEANGGTGLRDSRFGAETRAQSFGAGVYVVQGSTDENPRFIESINFGVDSDTADPITPGTVEVTVYEWYDLNFDGEVQGDPGNEKVKVGTATVLTQLMDDPRNVTVTPDALDEEGEPLAGEKIALKSNQAYLVMTHFNPFNGVNYINTVYSPSESNRNYHDGPTEFSYVQLGGDLTGIIGGLGAVDGVTHDDRDGARTFIPVFWGTSLVNTSVTPLAVATTDVNENIGINVYPNPAFETLTADISLEAMSETVVAEIVDVTGKVVTARKYYNMQNDKIALNVAALSNGVYVLNIRTDEGVNTQKFVVQNTK